MTSILHPGAQQHKPLREKFDPERIIRALSYTTSSGNWHLLARIRDDLSTSGQTISGEIFEQSPNKTYLFHRKHLWIYNEDTNTIFWQTRSNPPNYIRQIALELSQYLKGEL